MKPKFNKAQASVNESQPADSGLARFPLYSHGETES